MSKETNEFAQGPYYDLDEDHLALDGELPTGVDLNSPTPVHRSNGALSDECIAQYTEELQKVEEEMQTLRQVLAAKARRQRFLKEQLGLTVMSELRTSVNKGMDTLRSSEAFQKTTSAMKTAKDKTSATLQQKWSVLRQTGAFKSFEGKLGAAYNSVKWPSAATYLPLTEPGSIMNQLVRSASLRGSSSGASLGGPSRISVDVSEPDAHGTSKTAMGAPVKSKSSRPTTPGDDSLQKNAHIGDGTGELSQSGFDPKVLEAASDQFLD